MNGHIHFNPKKNAGAPRHALSYLMGSALALTFLVVMAKLFEDCLLPAQSALLCKWPWLQAAASQ